MRAKCYIRGRVGLALTLLLLILSCGEQPGRHVTSDILWDFAQEAEMPAPDQQQLPPLKILSVQPNSGPVEGGILAAVKGTGFVEGLRIWFGENEASNVVIESLYLVTCTVPPADAETMVDIKVTTPDGQESVLKNAFTYKGVTKKQLAITGIVPESGPASGGFLCLVNGQGFESGMSVRLGAKAGENVTVVSDTAVTFVAPPGNPGKVDVILKLGDQTAVLPDGFEYVPVEQEEPLSLSSIYPTSGPLEGGILAVISGSGFKQGVKIRFGENVANIVSIPSSNSMTVEVPAGEPGKVDIVAELGDKVSILPAAFYYIEEGEAEELTLTSIQPESGSDTGGYLAVLLGTGFSPALKIHLGEKQIDMFNVLSSQVVSFVVPPGEAGTVDVKVELGQQQAVLPEAFTYIASGQLAIISVQPSQGPVDGGTVCVVKGSGFGLDTMIFFGVSQAQVLDLSSDTTLVVHTPPASQPGPVDIVVQNSKGDSAVLETGFTYIQEEVLSASAIQPDSGLVQGGYLAMLSGTGFAPAMTVLFGDNPSPSVKIVSSQAAVVTVPAGEPGTVDVKVQNPNGEFAILPDAFTYMEEAVEGEPPALGLVSPKQGPVEGGTWVLIKGTNFTETTKVLFGPNQASELKYLDSQTLLASTPPGAPGFVDVTVQNPDGQESTLASAFKYTVVEGVQLVVSSIEPATGPITGGTLALVKGQGFVPGTTLFFAYQPVAKFKLLDEGQCSVIVPPGTQVGPVAVTAVRPDGVTFTLDNAFSYFDPQISQQLPPTLAGVFPEYGSANGGEKVTLSGTNFQEGIKVYLDYEPVQIVDFQGSSLVSVVTKAHPAGSVDVAVVNPDGQTALLADAYVFFVSPPFIATVVPDEGPVDGGNQVTITGAGFSAGAKVYWGQEMVAGLVVTPPDQIQLTAPPHEPGSVDVTVINPDGLMATKEEAYTYIEPEGIPAPEIISLSPTHGSSSGGYLVAITGDNFGDGAEVYFGENKSPFVQFLAPQALMAQVPAGQPGMQVDVSVVNPDGQQDVLESGFTYDELEVEPLAIYSVIPAIGPVEGGTSVAISGSGFVANSTQVLFGTEPASNVEVISDSVLTATTPPALGPGVVDVTVKNGVEEATLPGAFLYLQEEQPGPLPQIDAVSPSAGPVEGGTTVQILGANFQNGATVLFGGVDCESVEFISDSKLVISTPQNNAGSVSVVVINPDGMAGILAGAFTYYEESAAKKPILAAVVPDFGTALGGDIVTITGSNFVAGLNVYFCGLPASEVTVASASHITARTPAAAVGKCDVEVVNPDGQSGVLKDAFTFQAPQPILDNVVPSQGPPEGQTEVVLYGANFMQGMEVWFGVSESESVTVFSSDVASAVTPPGLEGKVDVKVVNPGGAFAVLENGFEYTKEPQAKEPPFIESLMPDAGPIQGGTIVTLTGANFQEGVQVFYGGVEALQVTFKDSTSLVVMTPPGQEGSVDVTVLNPDGQGFTLPEGFTYMIPSAPPPELFGVVPSSGPEEGGTTILVTGKNFTAKGMLYLGFQPVQQFTFINSSVISGITPAGEPGSVFVKYIGEDGQEASLENGFTYLPGPDIDNIEPIIGPVSGGTEVTIVGKNFQPQAEVLFGDQPAIEVTVENSLIIHAKTPPALAAGTVSVTVINDDGQKETLQDAFTYLLPPEITMVIPSAGQVTGGTPVSINGANFVEGLQVTFGNLDAVDVQLVSETLILCKSPKADSPGVVDLIVENPDGQLAIANAAFEYLEEVGPAPVLEAISPPSGPETGGTLVSLTGQNLGNPETVLMGNVPVTDFLFTSDTEVVFETPAHVPGAVNVTFIGADGGSAVLDNGFLYIPEEELQPPPEIAQVTPNIGPTAGGTAVTITGEAFQEAAVVFFGDIKAASTEFVSPEELKAVTPQQNAGMVDVAVLNPDGQVGVLASAFEFIPPPEVLSVSPDSGPAAGGNEVTITGANFWAGPTPSTRSSVHICNDFAAEQGCEKVLDSKIVTISETQIVFLAPQHTPGYVDVGVINPDGQKAFLGSAYYYNEPPTIDSIVPDSGPAEGGTNVTISGSAFQAGLKLFFADTECADVTLISDKEIHAVTPPGPNGPVDVRIQNPDGAEDVLDDGFLYIAGPEITKIYPTSGPEYGGTQVTIEGKYFSTQDEQAVVYFGQELVPLEDTTVVSSTIIQVITPPGQGPVSVTVENPDGQSDTLDEAFVYVPPAPPPVINYVIPAFGSGSGGYIVSVVGSGFMDGAQVFFGQTGEWVAGINPIVKNLGTMISVIAPPHDPGVVSVRVVNTNQQEVVLEGGFEFTEPEQLPPLGFTSIQPNRSPVQGGIIAAITGKGFKAGIKVYFGKEPDWVESDTDYIGPTILHVTVPPSPTNETGTFDVMLLNPSAPDDPDKVVAENAFAYTSGGVFAVKGMRLPIDNSDDRCALIADYNNDGLNDVAVFRGSGKGEVFVNTQPEDKEQAGWFVKSGDLTDWNGFTGWRVYGDFDGDGDIDIGERRSDRFGLMRNNGDGTFAGIQDKGWISWEARGMTAADFNCDGYLDVFIAVSSTSSDRPNRILVNDGNGNFTHYTTNVLPKHYEHTNMAAAADVDLDGDVDLVLANDSAMQNRIYYNNCNNIPGPPDCSKKICKVHEYNGHYYAVCEASKTWEAAKEFCELAGWYLAVINDAGEQNFVTSKLPNYEYWIAFSDQEEEGVWKWYGEEDSTYTYWGGGQPDNAGGSENCATIKWQWNGSWNDLPCGVNRRFVCETSKDLCPDWKFVDGQYGPGGNFPISGFNTRWISLVDIDGNGYPDAILGNWGQDVRIYMNYGGNFENDDLAHWPQNEENPYVDKLYPVDLDLDGDMDIVAKVKSGDWRWIRIYLNDLNNGGTGAFTLMPDAVPKRMSDTNSFEVGDLDGDLLPDIYIVNKNHQDQLLINNGFADPVNWTDENRVGIAHFAFNTIRGWPEHFDNTHDVAAGDIDGDGDLDIVRGNWKAKRISVYINDGNGRFWDESEDRMPETPFPTYIHLNNLVLHDMDNDGDLDVVMAGYKGCDWNASNFVSQIRIFLNDGNGYFEEKTQGNIPGPGSDSYLFLGIADLNGDGKPDIIASGRQHCYGWHGRYRALINGGDPFDTGAVYFFDKTSQWFPSYPDAAYGGIVEDFDADGFPDFYTGREEKQNRLFMNINGTNFQDVTSAYLPSVSDNTRKVTSADFDGDGDLDIYVVNNGQDRLHLQEIDHKFADATGSNMPLISRQSLDACVGDYDGDTMPDIFIVNWQQKNQLYLNTGSGKFVDQSSNLPWDTDYGRACAAGDFDGDGDIDVYVGASGLDHIYINEAGQ